MVDRHYIKKSAPCGKKYLRKAQEVLRDFPKRNLGGGESNLGGGEAKLGGGNLKFGVGDLKFGVGQ